LEADILDARNRFEHYFIDTQIPLLRISPSSLPNFRSLFNGSMNPTLRPFHRPEMLGGNTTLSSRLNYGIEHIGFLSINSRLKLFYVETRHYWVDYVRD
jgi:hypothetical protein